MPPEKVPSSRSPARPSGSALPSTPDPQPSLFPEEDARHAWQHRAFAYAYTAANDLQAKTTQDLTAHVRATLRRTLSLARQEGLDHETARFMAAALWQMTEQWEEECGRHAPPAASEDKFRRN